MRNKQAPPGPGSSMDELAPVAGDLNQELLFLYMEILVGPDETWSRLLWSVLGRLIVRLIEETTENNDGI